MKKIVILSMLMLVMVSTSSAQDSCIVRPSCADMGYTKTESECSGKTTLKCPFDLSKVSCEVGNENNENNNYIPKEKIRFGKLQDFGAKVIKTNTIYDYNDYGAVVETVKSLYGTLFKYCELTQEYISSADMCKSRENVQHEYNKDTVVYINEDYKSKDNCNVGDYYFNDDTCCAFDFGEKTILGVVINSNNRLVMGLKDIGSDVFYRFNEVDVEGVSNSTSELNGKANTSAFDNNGGNLAQTCKIVNGGNKDWYVPSVGELHLLYLQSPIIGQRLGLNTYSTESYSYITDYTEYNSYGTTLCSSTIASKTSMYSVYIRPEDYNYERLATSNSTISKINVGNVRCVFKY